MLHLQAGKAPLIITRECRSREEAERWARELFERGFWPVTIDGREFEPKIAIEVQAQT